VPWPAARAARRCARSRCRGAEGPVLALTAVSGRACRARAPPREQDRRARRAARWCGVHAVVSRRARRSRAHAEPRPRCSRCPTLAGGLVMASALVCARGARVGWRWPRPQRPTLAAGASLAHSSSCPTLAGGVVLAGLYTRGSRTRRKLAGGPVMASAPVFQRRARRSRVGWRWPRPGRPTLADGLALAVFGTRALPKVALLVTASSRAGERTRRRPRVRSDVHTGGGTRRGASGASVARLRTRPGQTATGRPPRAPRRLAPLYVTRFTFLFTS
jgi:hypothetical protein